MSGDTVEVRIGRERNLPLGRGMVGDKTYSSDHWFYLEFIEPGWTPAL